LALDSAIVQVGMMTTDLRFPIGRFERPTTFTDASRAAAVAAIAATPADLRAAVRGLTDAQLDTPYRPGGWTVRQLVHHVPDSHLNACIRTRLALTEDNPTIKPYEEQRWAELADAKTMPVEVSLTLLDALHERWVALLRTFGPAEFSRTLVHPQNGPMTLDGLLALYAWHGKHHVAHVTALRSRSGWPPAP
jgi:uncharacterized damage-inducible protein DinB